MPDSKSTKADTEIRSTDRSLPIALLRARETLMGPIRDMLGQSGISEQKWRILRVLEESGVMEQTAIAQSACLLLPSLTRILKSMEHDGLITRKTNPNDRRRTKVEISKKGTALILDHIAQSNALFAELEKEFGKQELARLLDLLEALQKIKL